MSDIDELEELLAEADLKLPLSTSIGHMTVYDRDDTVIASRLNNADLYVALHNEAPGMIAELRALRAENAALREAQQAVCEWRKSVSYDEDTITTACGQEFVFSDDYDDSYSYKFCPECGKPIKHIHPEPLFTEDDE